MILTNRLHEWLAGTLVVVACLSNNALLAQNAPGNPTDAHIVTLSGKVNIQAHGETSWHPAKPDDTLHLGDRVQTTKNSRATIRLSNLSLLRVYELTTLEIQPPDQPGHRAVLNLESGTAYFFNRDKPSETQFRTPSASGAIRGTEFNLSVKANGRMELALLDGQVDLTNNQGTLQVSSGQEAVADPGQAPKKMALIDAVNIIQWTLYYPAILDTDDLELSDDSKKGLGESLDAYRNGDLLGAIEKYGSHTPGSDSERIYNAALLLGVGQVEAAQQLLQEGSKESRAGALANALQEMIAAVKGQPFNRTEPRALATEWLAGSYYAQAQRNLPQALEMAKRAVAKSPNFGFAQERLAEMEFSFGDADSALMALNKSLVTAPHNAQALSLKGFTLSAQNKIREAGDYFDKAIAADGSQANGWLGRGLVRIRRGKVDAGRKDLETAASLEPNRAFLRSYLGKAWSLDQPFQYSWNTHLATNELNRSKMLDPQDPTAWLYSALLNDQRNCINQAITDLEKSAELNNNRAVFRSKFLLDQDSAVRSANLALIYEDAGMSDVAVREATKALNSDYANYSAHLFLSETYDALQDPKREDLRYQTPWEDELLIANLLAPVGAGVLSQNISQSEYSKMFTSDRLGVINQTVFQSRGAWLENASEFGTFGPLAFSVEQYYFTDPGWRPNNAVENTDFSLKLKYQLTPKDTVFAEVERTELQAGDPFQYYNWNVPKTAGVFGYDPTLHEYETESPNILAGYHHDWGTGNDTVFLFRALQDQFSSEDGTPASPLYVAPTVTLGTALNFVNGAAYESLRRTMELYSFEVQHIYQNDMNNVIVGARYQNEDANTASVMNPAVGSASTFTYPGIVHSTYDRFSGYAYYTLKLGDAFKFTLGGTYDWEHFPENLGQPPLDSKETDRERFSPKVGIDYTLPEGTRLRAAYTRSMGGLVNDSSTSIEPTTIAGFNQSYRSLIPQSAGYGTPPGLQFETWGLGVDHKFPTGTYVDLEAQLLTSTGNQLIGAWNQTTLGGPLTVSDFSQSQYYQEKDLFASVNQLIGSNVSVGLRYTLTQVDVSAKDYVPALGFVLTQNHENSTLNEISLFGNYYLPCGFFARAEANYWVQNNAFNYTTAAGTPASEPGSDFVQCNFYAGYRFPQRHIEAMVGLINAFDTGYNIDPATYFLEQAHQRSFIASLKFNF